jgi:hypothetical protein
MIYVHSNSFKTLHSHHPPSPLVQELVEEVNRTPLRPLQSILLLLVVGVTTRRKAVRQTREVNVLPLHPSLWQRLQRSLLQLLRVCEVVFGGEDLHGDLDALDLGLLEQGGVGGRDGVDERGLGGELEARPAAVAEADGCDLFVLRLERLRVLLDFRPANVLGVAAQEGHEVELLLLLWVGQCVWVYDFAAETVRWLLVALNVGVTSRSCLHIGYVDGRIGFLRVVVCEDADVGESPAEDVGDDKDSGILVVAGDIAVDVVELGLLANGLAVPLEAGFAVVAGHLEV